MAALTGQDVRAVYRAPYDLTLYTFYLQGFRERQARAVRLTDLESEVYGVALAVNDPQKLTQWGHDLRRSIGLVPARDPDAEKARIAKMTDALERGARERIN